MQDEAEVNVTAEDFDCALKIQKAVKALPSGAAGFKNAATARKCAAEAF